MQLCEKREQLQQIISPSFFFFFARAISARENLTGHRLLHRETTSEQKGKRKKKKGRYAQQQNYAMKDITYIQAQIQSPLSITEFSILVNRPHPPLSSPLPSRKTLVSASSLKQKNREKNRKNIRLDIKHPALKKM